MNIDGSGKENRGTGNPKDDGVKTLQQEIAKMAKQFEAALPKAITPERMMRIVLTAIRKQPDLALCPPESFFGAVLTALQLGLEINTPLGQCYIISYNREISFQMGYQGIIELAYRSNKYKRIDAEVVYMGDKFEYTYGLPSRLAHKPCGKRENPTHVYALYELVNGGGNFKVWTWDAVINHAKTYSKSYKASSSPWTAKNPETVESMAKKTLLINVLKYAPKSVEIAQAITADDSDIQARVVDDGSFSFIDFEFRPNQIAPPDETMKTPRRQAPAAEKAAREAAQADREEQAEPIPAAKPKGTGTGKTQGLFARDEEEAMEEEYERHTAGGVVPPDFGN
jgi:recombination protein RecT